MRKIVVYQKPTSWNPIKIKCFECYIVNDHQLQRLTNWFNPDEASLGRSDGYMIEELP